MRWLLIFAAMLFCPLLITAQSGARQSGEPASRDAGLRRLRDDERLHIGLPLPDFSAETGDGQHISNARMKGNVYLLTVFYPECHCFRPEGIKGVFALESTHKDFHVLAIIQDTAYLYVYRQDHADPLHYAVTATREQAVALRLAHSLPLYILVNRQGIVTKMISGAELSQLNESEEDQADLVKVIGEALRY